MFNKFNQVSFKKSFSKVLAVFSLFSMLIVGGTSTINTLANAGKCTTNGINVYEYNETDKQCVPNNCPEGSYSQFPTKKGNLLYYKCVTSEQANVCDSDHYNLKEWYWCYPNTACNSSEKLTWFKSTDPKKDYYPETVYGVNESSHKAGYQSYWVGECIAKKLPVKPVKIYVPAPKTTTIPCKKITQGPQAGDCSSCPNGTSYFWQSIQDYKCSKEPTVTAKSTPKTTITNYRQVCQNKINLLNAEVTKIQKNPKNYSDSSGQISRREDQIDLYAYNRDNNVSCS
jgi:hypothetical protein